MVFLLFSSLLYYTISHDRNQEKFVFLTAIFLTPTEVVGVKVYNTVAAAK
jgi:hypothetical protein